MPPLITPHLLLVVSPIHDYLANHRTTHQARNAGRSHLCRSQKDKPYREHALEFRQNQYARFIHVVPSQMVWRHQKRRTVVSALKIHTQGEEFTVQPFHTGNPTYAPRCLLKLSRNGHLRARDYLLESNNRGQNH